MIHALALLLLAQLGGEVAARALALPVPGPVLGMVALTGALALSPRLMALVRPVAQGLLGHLALLFVPAGVGVVGHLPALAGHGAALAVVVVSSTVLAIAAGALTFAAVARLTGSAEPRE
jgi:putative effector of murein hydrolase LrgA (UPF0299 family)